MALLASNLVAGEMPQDLHSARLLVGPCRSLSVTYSAICQEGLGSTLGKPATGVEGARPVRSS